MLLLIYYSGLGYFVRLIFGKIFKNPPRVLFSHNIISQDDDYYEFLQGLGHLTLEEFEAKIRFLLKKYKFVSLGECLNIRPEDRSANLVVLTFDDGYKNIHSNVFPILKKYKIPAIIYLTTETIGSGKMLWSDKLIHALTKTENIKVAIPEIFDRSFKISTLNEKLNFYKIVSNEMKKFNEEKKEVILKQIIDQLLSANRENQSKDLMLNWDEIKEMHESGLVEFGAHTETHPILTKIPLDKVKREILKSKSTIEEQLKCRVESFAYPNGNYNDHIKTIVRELSFSSAVTTADDPFQVDNFAIGRIGFDHEPLFLFALHVAGIYNLLFKFNESIRYAQYWLLGYAFERLLNKFTKNCRKKPIYLFVCICDHFEPLWNGVNKSEGLERVNQWVANYPDIASRHKDSLGKSPKYTFFFPEEEYTPELLEGLGNICNKGYGEVEIHLHHDNDTPEMLTEKLINFKEKLNRDHKMLSRCKQTGEIAYGFIHGDWALANSRKDGKFCGVNNELEVLRDTGCYADFTLPSVPSDTQTAKVNSIYYAKDIPDLPKSHNWGVNVKTNTKEKKRLLMIQGPLAINWKKRKGAFCPTIESGNIGYTDPVDLHRLKLWIDTNIHVEGESNFRFIKLHAHGCQEENMRFLLEGGLDNLYNLLEEHCNDGEKFKLHYVTARELVNIVKALEAGECLFDSERLVEAMNYRYELKGVGNA